ncbi:MAG: NADH-quinone oxidoreductase subunit N [Phycisphaerae bacterium]|jgi:NADH-quinone oxidoreductase subunit N|nr:NADH-quinone oxidoreductase subunit N [Phycisphaerae bacterium]
MIERLWFLLPELIMLAGAVSCAILGISRQVSIRRSLPVVAIVTLIVTLLATCWVYSADMSSMVDGAWALPMPWLGKTLIGLSVVVGIVLVLVQAGFVDRVYEATVAEGRTTFDPLRTSRGEYYVFFLLSMCGLMLTGMAPDLIWLFLALELTSLPTYVMVAIGRTDRRAQEAAMKYFFLGAMAAAIFLFGFALLYGATGTMSLVDMKTVLTARMAETGSIGTLATLGLLLSIFGIAFKLAAAPLHMYAADVYEGAAAPVTAFLGFVPKAGGVVALLLLLSITGWMDNGGTLPQPILIALWIMAVLTMTLGNIGALLQTRVKRMLAYSSISHSGYILIGIIAGPGAGFAAVLVYLLGYGLSNTATFAVLASLKRGGGEVETLDDLSGLRERHPAMAWAMAISAGSLLGFPPLLGFWGKLLLFMAGIASGHLVLVVIAAVNSAISAWYYLRLVALPLTGASSASGRGVERGDWNGPRVAAILACAAVIVVPIFLSDILGEAEEGVRSTDVQIEHAAVLVSDEIR